MIDDNLASPILVPQTRRIAANIAKVPEVLRKVTVTDLCSTSLLRIAADYDRLAEWAEENSVPWWDKKRVVG